MNYEIKGLKLAKVKFDGGQKGKQYINTLSSSNDFTCKIHQEFRNRILYSTFNEMVPYPLGGSFCGDC